MKYKKHIITPKLRSFSANSGEKVLDTVEVDKSPPLAASSTSDVAKNAHAHYAMWALCIFYLILSYLLFASSTGASFIALPITLIFGPVASYNILIIIGNALSAYFTFLITKYLTKSFTAGVIAGLLFGFSTYQFVQVIHLHTELTFLISLIAYLFLLFWEQKIQSIAFILLVGSCLTLQYLFVIEVFVTLTLFIGISGIIFMLVYPEHFKKLIRFSMNLSGAYGFCVILLLPFIYTAFINRIPTKPFNSAVFFSIDPLNFIIPTQSTSIGANAFAQLSGTFFGSIYETSGYLGIPALAIIIPYSVKGIGTISGG